MKKPVKCFVPSCGKYRNFFDRIYIKKKVKVSGSKFTVVIEK